jgi:hypothetical protein
MSGPALTMVCSRLTCGAGAVTACMSGSGAPGPAAVPASRASRPRRRHGLIPRAKRPGLRRLHDPSQVVRITSRSGAVQDEGQPMSGFCRRLSNSLDELAFQRCADRGGGVGSRAGSSAATGGATAASPGSSLARAMPVPPGRPTTSTGSSRSACRRVVLFQPVRRSPSGGTHAPASRAESICESLATTTRTKPRGAACQLPMLSLAHFLNALQRRTTGWRSAVRLPTCLATDEYIIGIYP